MTILGQHTVNELRDLIRSKDDDLAKLRAGADAFASTWQSADSDGYTAWQKDWNALVTRYQSAKTAASIVFAAQKANPISDDLTPAEDTYGFVLKSLQKTPGVVSPGDKQDLYGRLIAAGSTLKYVVVQPTAPDMDLKAFIASDALAKKIDAGASTAKKWISSPWTWAIGGLGALAVLIVGVKVLK